MVGRQGNTVVGNDVWIGEGALVLSGITIGDGVVIGARAVVTKDVPPYTVVAGNPGRIVRKRFTDDQISALLSIQWWNWSKESITKAIPLLSCEDVQKFIEYAKRTMAPTAFAAAP